MQIQLEVQGIWQVCNPSNYQLCLQMIKTAIDKPMENIVQTWIHIAVKCLKLQMRQGEIQAAVVMYHGLEASQMLNHEAIILSNKIQIMYQLANRQRSIVINEVWETYQFSLDQIIPRFLFAPIQEMTNI